MPNLQSGRGQEVATESGEIDGGAMTDPDPFSWNDEGNIVVRQHDALACHPNPYGDAVLRRERSWDEDFDAVIVIPSDHAIAVAAAILVAAGHGDVLFYRMNSDGRCEDVEVTRPHPADSAGKLPTPEKELEPRANLAPGSKPRDPTAAERARRYRNKRHGDRHGESVTRHGVTTVTNSQGEPEQRELLE